MNISTAELLDALRSAGGDSAVDLDGSFSTTELMEAMRWSRPAALQNLKQLKRDGALEIVRIRREAVDGRVMLMAGYRILKKKAKGGANK